MGGAAGLTISTSCDIIKSPCCLLQKNLTSTLFLKMNSINRNTYGGFGGLRRLTKMLRKNLTGLEITFTLYCGF